MASPKPVLGAYLDAGALGSMSMMAQSMQVEADRASRLGKRPADTTDRSVFGDLGAVPRAIRNWSPDRDAYRCLKPADEATLLATWDPADFKFCCLSVSDGRIFLTPFLAAVPASQVEFHYVLNQLINFRYFDQITRTALRKFLYTNFCIAQPQYDQLRIDPAAIPRYAVRLPNDLQRESDMERMRALFYMSAHQLLRSAYPYGDADTAVRHDGLLRLPWTLKNDNAFGRDDPRTSLGEFSVAYLMLLDDGKFWDASFAMSGQATTPLVAVETSRQQLQKQLESTARSDLLDEMIQKDRAKEAVDAARRKAATAILQRFEERTVDNGSRSFAQRYLRVAAVGTAAMLPSFLTGVVLSSVASIALAEAIALFKARDDEAMLTRYIADEYRRRHLSAISGPKHRMIDGPDDLTAIMKAQSHAVMQGAYDE